MKKIIILCSIFIAIFSQTKAQCPGAILDSACFTARIGTGGGICRDSLTTGMANNPYLDDVSFVMPPSVNITTPITATVTLRRIYITGISGLPLGLNWQCDNGSCIYLPSSGQQLGAIRFCGTPLTSGVFNLTVYISADVTVSGVGDRNGEAQVYNTQLRILPDTNGGNPTFTHTPTGNSFCDTTDLTYNALITSSTNPVKYNWTFGNGNTSTLQNPPTQNYVPSLTDYNAVLKTTIYAYRVTRVRVIGTNGSLWSGDIGELTTLQSPDFVFANTTTGRSTPEISNNKTPDWTGLRDTIPIGTDSVNFTLTDIDGSLFGLDPNDLVETGVFPVQLGTVNYIHGSNSIQITMDTIPGQVFYDTLKLTINAPLTAGITSTLVDSFCNGDSTIISVNYPNTGYSFQWYKDSTIIPLATDSFLTVNSSGSYYVTIQNTATLCSTGSSITRIYSFSNPPGILSVVSAGPGQIANSNFPGTGFTIEWYKDGVLIPGGNNVVLPTSGDGTYTCHVYNTALPLCDRTSPAYTITGIEEDIVSFGSHVSIYPNPSNGKFILTFESLNTDKNATISISDITGREVYHNALEINKGLSKIPFDTDNLSNGVYILHLNSNGNSIDKRLVISK